MYPVGARVLQRPDCELEGRARNVDIPVPDGHCVDAQLMWDKVDRIQALLLLGDVCLGGLAGGGGHHGLQVIHEYPRHLECQPALRTNLSDWDSLSHPLDVLSDLLAALARDGHLEWGPRNMGVCKLDVDDVEARLGWFVVNIQGAILIVFTINLCFGGSFNGERQASISSRLGVNHEAVVDMSLPLHQTIPGHLDAAGIPHLLGIHNYLKWRVGYVFSTLLNGHQMFSNFSWSEGNANITPGKFLQEALFNNTRWALYVCL